MLPTIRQRNGSPLPSGEPISPRLVGDTLLNLAGRLASILPMLAVIPVLTGSLGPERFGVFSLFWAIVAATRIMDFGVSRATTKYVAEYRSTERRGEIPDLVWSSMAVHILIGVVLGLLVLLPYPATSGLLVIPPALATETANAVIVLALGIPFLLLLASLRSTVEGCQQFRAYNVIHVTWELVAFAGLAVLAKLDFSMPVLIGQLILARALAAASYLTLCFRLLPQVRSSMIVRFATIKKLLGFGVWIGIADSLQQAYGYADRFLVAALVSVSAVTYYSIPQEIVARLWILPISMVTVTFPLFSQLGGSGSERLHAAFAHSAKVLVVGIAPVAILLTAASREILEVWLGETLAAGSFRILQVFTVGLFLASLAPLSTSLLRALGYAKTVLLLHLLELPFYFAFLWLMLKHWGVVGAAGAWSLRWCVHALLLLYAGAKHELVPLNALRKGNLDRLTLVMVLSSIVSLVLPSLLSGAALFAAIGATVAVVAVSAWLWVLDPNDKRVFYALLRRDLAATI